MKDHEPISETELLNSQSTKYLTKHQEGLKKLGTAETIGSLEIIDYILIQRSKFDKVLNCQGICDGSCKSNCKLIKWIK